MIKQIQLRGISRTPSDRMSEDGGLSESLNMYLDTAENAPAFVPEDITTKLGLPADLVAERIFIHKTANYENYIVVQEGKIVAYTPGIEDEEPLLVMDLAEGEIVNDITSVGNTLILSAGETLIYFLYKDREYKELNGIPDISLSVLASDALSVASELNDNFPIRYTSITFEDAIFELGNESNNYTITDEQTLEKVSVIYDKYIEIVSHNLMLGTFNFPVFAIYATRLYDGTLINISSPIMLGTQLLNGTQGLIMKSPVIFTKERIQKAERDYDLVVRMYLNNPYHIGVYKNVPKVITEWRDIVSSVELFISPIYNILPMGKNHGKDDSEQFNTRDAFVLDPNNIENFKNKESLLLNNIYKKVKSWSIDELIDDDGSIEKIIMDFRGENISSKENLSDNVLVNQGVFAKNFLVYNRKLISYDSSVSVQNALPFLNGQHAYAGSRDDIEYAFSFFLNNGQIINAVDPSGQLYINASKGFYLGYKGAAISQIERICEPFSWLSFPDSKCEKVRVYKKQDGVVKEVDLPMKIHPTAPNSAYAFLDYNTCLSELDYQESQGPQEQLKGKENKENVLFVSKVDNPFVFPLESRYTFQSKIVGVAIATTALSQGQFGQFPLYVFTEDGIWAMETAADGSFVSQKPLSREVCNNPDSITSIDNAVVFTTAKAVMMIQGSQVINISPYMNGRHYIPNESATSIIARQEGFGEFENAIKDETPFVAFMKKAKIAYDYAGQRLICIADDETFQYVYKIDTQTWHKTLFENTILQTPINSFPECFTLGSFKISENKKAQILSLLQLEQWSDLEQAITDGTSFVSYEYEQETTIADKVCALGVVTTTTFKGDILRVVVSDISRNNVSAEQADKERIQAFMEVPKYIESLMLGLRYTDVFRCSPNDRSTLLDLLSKYFTYSILTEEQWHEHKFVLNGFREQAVYSLGTILDVDPESEDAPKVSKGILITRPFDLGMPDVYKSITSIKIRGDFDKGNVKYILQGSDDGRTFYTLNTLRGKSWRMFRLFILADLEPTERISWIDVDFEPRYQNKLR